MPCQRGLDRGLQRFQIADLAHHDDVRILAEDRAKALGKREAGLFVNLSLVDAGDGVLDGIFNRDDVLAGFHQLRQRHLASVRDATCRRALNPDIADGTLVLPRLFVKGTKRALSKDFA